MRPGLRGVLIRVRAASLNAADWHLAHMPPARAILGLLGKRTPGFDVAGDVVAVGAQVRDLAPGVAVFGTAHGSCAEFVVGRADRLAPKPQALTYEQVAALPIAGVSALQGLRDKGRLEPGQRVLIHGAGGGVGTFAVQIARALGAHVTAVTGPRNLDTVRALGPDELIDYSREDFTRRGQQYDVFLDVAATRSLRDCLRVVKRQGTYVGVGAPKAGLLAILAGSVDTLVRSLFVSQRVVSFLARARRADLMALVDLALAGKLAPVIDRTYPLSEVPEAMRYMGSGHARAKVVITVS